MPLISIDCQSCFYNKNLITINNYTMQPSDVDRMRYIYNIAGEKCDSRSCPPPEIEHPIQVQGKGRPVREMEKRIV